MTRVIYPYTYLFTEATAALDRYAPDHERHFVGWGDSAYWWWLTEVWKGHEGFMNVEHDVVIGPDTLPAFDACSEPWCTAPVPRHAPPHQPLTHSLGCVRFSAELVRGVPDLLQLAAEYDAGLPPRHWQHLDDSIAWVLDGLGFKPCVHDVAVRHLCNAEEVPA